VIVSGSLSSRKAFGDLCGTTKRKTPKKKTTQRRRGALRFAEKWAAAVQAFLRVRKSKDNAETQRVAEVRREVASCRPIVSKSSKEYV
jgi:hypothetical protein